MRAPAGGISSGCAGLRFRSEGVADLPEPVQIVNVLGLCRDLGQRHQRVGGGEMLSRPALGRGLFHPVRVQPQRRNRQPPGRGFRPSGADACRTSAAARLLAADSCAAGTC